MTGAEGTVRQLRWYPKSWQDRYGEELIMFMQDRYGGDRLPLGSRLSLVTGGLRERARQSGLYGDSVPPLDRVRGGVLVVLGAVAAFAVAGASVQKSSEHFDVALGPIRQIHVLPDNAFTVVQTAGTLAACITLVGAIFAVPAFLRFLRSGGWPQIRNHVARAATASAITAGMTVWLVLWATVSVASNAADPTPATPSCSSPGPPW
jgi:hypothetical protein